MGGTGANMERGGVLCLCQEWAIVLFRGGGIVFLNVDPCRINEESGGGKMEGGDMTGVGVTGVGVEMFQTLWMWRQEYQHHEQLPLAFNGTWPSWNSDLDNRP
eukprot:752200-Hanusia_phi.AAC.7